MQTTTTTTTTTSTSSSTLVSVPSPAVGRRRRSRPTERRQRGSLRRGSDASSSFKVSAVEEIKSSSSSEETKGEEDYNIDNNVDINNMEQLLRRHDIEDIFLDQFGVLHDGKNPFPEAIECLRRIHEEFPRVRVHIISNSSRRRSSTLRKLKRMGFEEEWFYSAMTSGEVCHRYIEEEILSNATEHTSSSFTFLHLNWGERGAVTLPSGCVLPQSKEEAIEKTTHIVASGCESMSIPGTTLGSYDREVQNIARLTHEEIKEVLTGIAKRCRQSGAAPPKMMLANPDYVTVNGDKLEVMPGTISLWYKDILNETYKESSGAFSADEYVVKLGKPAPIIYTTLCKELSENSSKNEEAKEDATNFFFSKCLCVGDSLEHDIKGAQSVDAKSCFIVETGIHAEEFNFSSLASGGEGNEGVEPALASMCKKYNVAPPTCTIAKFSWK